MNCRQSLTHALIRRLRPGSREYTVRDTVVPSLGVRVHPSGGRAWIHVVDGRKVSLGPAALKTVQDRRGASPCALRAPARSGVASWRCCLAPCTLGAP